MGKLQHIKSAILLLVILTYSSCKKDSWCKECFERTGKITTQKRTLNAFNKINVYENVSVYITQDSVFDVQVEAGENMLALITTEVTDSVLIIKNKNRCNWTRSYKKPFNVYIKMPVVKYITSNTSGIIKSLNTLNVYKLGIEALSFGDIELTLNTTLIESNIREGSNLTLYGKSYYHDCLVRSSAFAYCKDLVTNYTYLRAYSTGLCYVNATNKLVYRISSTSDVYCYGNPPNVFDDSSIGKGKIYFK